MQAARKEESGGARNADKPQYHPRRRLRDMKVKDLIVEKKGLVEVPYTATLAQTLNTLTENRVVAVPVAAPPGHWIGAGGSMIVEVDEMTGIPKKQFIGIVTMVDILVHIGEGGGDSDLDHKMSVPVSSIIGHCTESLSLWTLNPDTNILDSMEVFSKGIHRALVPMDGHIGNPVGAELADSASSYGMLTQMDVLRFLKKHDHELEGILNYKVKGKELGAVTDTVFGVTDRAEVIKAIKCMRRSSLVAVPIVESSKFIPEDPSQLVNGKNRKLMGTFSASDLKRCSISQLQSSMKMSVAEFVGEISGSSFHKLSGSAEISTRKIVACHAESPFREALEKAVSNHVHRVWVIDQKGLLQGVVSLTDMIRVIRLWLLSDQATF